MATYYSTGYENSQAVGDQGSGADITVPFVFDTTEISATVTDNDLIKLVKIPKGAVITNWYMNWPDTDGGTSGRVKVGMVTNTSVVLLPISTICQGGVACPTNAPNGLTAAEALPQVIVGGTTASPTAVDTNGFDVLQIEVTTTGAAGSAGSLKGYVTYNLRTQMYDTFTTLYAGV